MTAVLARLNIARKLLIFSAVLALPIIVLLYSVVSEYTEGIRATKNELEGTRRIEHLQRIAEDIRVHQRTSYLVLEGDRRWEREHSEAARRIDEALSGAPAPQVAARWQQLCTRPPATPADSVAAHQQLAVAVQAQVREVADSSMLVLDSELDSYYLAELAGVLLPEAQETIADAAMLATEAALGHPVPQRDLMEFAGYAEALESSTLPQVRHAVETSLREDRAFHGVSESLQRNLPRSLNRYQAELTACADQMRRYSQLDSNVTAPQLAALAVHTGQAGSDFQRTAIAELRVLFDKRISDLRWKRTAVLGSGILALALTWLIVSVIARNITVPLEEMAKLAAEVAGGRVKEAREQLQAGAIRKVLASSGARDEIHQLMHAIAHMTDSLDSLLAERKRAEEALSRSERLSRLIMDAGPTLISYVDSDCRYRWANRVYESWFGRTPEEIRGRHVSEVLGEAVWQAVRPYVERALAGEIVVYEHQLLLRRGAPRWVQTTYTPERDESGCIRGFVVHAMDVSGLKKMERERLELLAKERALASEKALRETEAELARVARALSVGELATSIAHEVNQPLAGVVTNAEAGLRWLGGETPNLHEARESLGLIVRDANRASGVIRRIREFLKKETQQTASLDINEMIREAVALAHGDLLKRQTVLRIELSGGLPAVRADRIQLQQVVLNLIMNGGEAMASTRGSRELLVTSQKSSDGGVLVAVRDSGVGINPQDVHRMFGAFFTTKPDGMGMGLSISRSIVEAHGGRIWAESNNGPGLTVQFSLPRATVSEESQAASSPS